MEGEEVVQEPLERILGLGVDDGGAGLLKEKVQVGV